MTRIIRNRRLTPEEAAEYRTVREQVEVELSDLIARHQQRMEALDQMHSPFDELKGVAKRTALKMNSDRINRIDRILMMKFC